VDLHRKRQVEMFGQIARHLVALVYFVAELVLGEKAPKLGSSQPMTECGLLAEHYRQIEAFVVT